MLKRSPGIAPGVRHTQGGTTMNNNKPFKYVPSWQTSAPGYLAAKFKKIQREMQQQKEKAANAPSKEQ